MDLDHHGRAELASELVDEYVGCSGDVELPCLLDFYRAYRACVRGKVLSFRLEEATLDPRSREQITAEAQAYFDLAHAYASVRRPRIVVVMGLPATGKTTLASKLACRLGLVHISSDQVRKGLAGLRRDEPRPEPFRGGIYGRAMTRRVYSAMRGVARRWLRRGRSVVLDATFGDARERAAVRRMAVRAGASVRFMVCQAPDGTIVERLAARAGQSGGSSDARPELWPELKAAYGAPDELTDAIAIDTTVPLRCAVAALLAVLRSEDQRAVPGEPGCLRHKSPDGCEIGRNFGCVRFDPARNFDRTNPDPNEGPGAGGLAMGNDARIQRAVLEAFDGDARIGEAAVGVQVTNGIVTLTGVVRDYAQRLAAREIAHRVPDVLDVADDIAVHARSGEPTDTEVALAVRHALDSLPSVVGHRIRSTVMARWVTLEGDVDHARQRDEAERAVAHITDVAGVTDRVVVVPPGGTT
jgi:predicted kinase/osmotically-inducible protein OsmY